MNPEFAEPGEGLSIEKFMRGVGAKVLNQAGFRGAHQEIVDSSFNKARSRGEKLIGKNDERRVDAYLSRLDKIISKFGNKAEKRLWQASIKDNLFTKYEDIPEAYWDTKRQEYRDNGHGYITLEDEDSKRIIYNEEIFDLQRESLKAWANYLGDENTRYPLWFKVYAWDGITKMGKWDKNKGEYARRNKTTVAPYPEPNAEVLNSVFEVINKYHGNGEKEFYTEEGERNIDLEKLVQSGNFAKIYNAIERGIAPVIKPPERAEDVRGQWIEYKPGQEQEIAAAGRETGWCIGNSPSKAREYLTREANGQVDNDNDLKSRFILFHLEDPKTGKLSRNAVASVRLNLDGKVAEISGIEEGQTLTDSLISIVEEKVKSLPGGEEFLPKFVDNKQLIALDRKMKNDENLTKEELEFLYEIYRPINTLGYSDQRINELRNRYGIEYALDNGLGIDGLIPHMRVGDVHTGNFDNFINRGATIDQLIPEMHPDYIADFLDFFTNRGATIDQLISGMGPHYVGRHVKNLIDRGIDANRLVYGMYPNDVAENLDILIDHNVNIDIGHLISKMNSYGINESLDILIDHGATNDHLIPRMQKSDICRHLDKLIENGANINLLVSNLKPIDIARNLDTLIAHDANINIDRLVSNLEPAEIAATLDTLIAHGANINKDRIPDFEYEFPVEEDVEEPIESEELYA